MSAFTTDEIKTKLDDWLDAVNGSPTGKGKWKRLSKSKNGAGNDVRVFENTTLNLQVSTEETGWGLDVTYNGKTTTMSSTAALPDLPALKVAPLPNPGLPVHLSAVLASVDVEPQAPKTKAKKAEPTAGRKITDLSHRIVYLQVPKGTEILEDDRENGFYGYKKAVATTTKRVKGMITHHDFHNNDAVVVREFLSLPAVAPQMFSHNGHPPSARHQPVSVKNALVQWGEYPYTYARVKDVLEVDPPAPAVRKDNGPSMRQLLQPGSEWELAEDYQLETVRIEKRDNSAGVAERKAKGWSVGPVHTWDCKIYEKNGPVIAKGTRFKVDSKPYDHHGWANESEGREGFYVVADFSGQKRALKVAGLQATAITEAEAQPVFVLRDTATGQFYSDYEGYRWGHGGGTPVYSDKFSKARKWNRLSDVRGALLGFSGYFDDLPGAENLPEWMGGPKVFDVPQTWEIVKINKLTKSEMETIEAMETFNRAWKLRVLTVQYGSAVRATYSELEKKEKLGEFSAMLVFTLADEENRRSWWDDGLNEDEMAEIKDAISGFDKKDVKAGKGKTAYAVATKDVQTAMMIKLSYSGTMDLKLLDLQNLVEVADALVDTKAA